MNYELEFNNDYLYHETRTREVLDAEKFSGHRPDIPEISSRQLTDGRGQGQSSLKCFKRTGNCVTPPGG